MSTDPQQQSPPPSSSSSDNDDDDSDVDPSGIREELKTMELEAPKSHRRVNTGAGRVYRMKKSIMSRLANSKTGRRIITRQLGPLGAELLKSLKAAATSFASKRVARKLKRDILKLASKIQMMVDGGRITEANSSHIQVDAYLDSLNDALNTPQVTNAEVHKVADISTVITDQLTALVRPHMQTKNTDRLRYVCQFYSDPLFIRDVLNDAEYATTVDTLRKLMPVLKRERSSVVSARMRLQKLPLCRVRACPHPQLQPSGKTFIGSQYCRRHHVEVYADYVNQPELHMFLESGSYASQCFVEFLTALQQRRQHEYKYNNDNDDDGGGGYVRKPVTLYRLCSLIEQYRRLNASLRLRRAELIVSQFFSRLSDVGMTDDMRRDVMDAMIQFRVASHPSSSSLYHVFDAVYAEGASLLRELFGDFMRSQDFLAFTQSLALPEKTPTIIMGPVIGKVTKDSARILVEFDERVSVVSVLEPGNIRAVHETQPYRPCVLKMTGLTTSTKYTLKILYNDEELMYPFAQVTMAPVARTQSFRRRRGSSVEAKHQQCSFTTFPERLVRDDDNDDGDADDEDANNCRFAFVACNSEKYLHTIPASGDLWLHLQAEVLADRIQCICHIGDNIYVDIDEFKGEKSTVNKRCRSLLAGKPPSTWPQYADACQELFRQIYRKTWTYPSVAVTLANCANMMIHDDHDIMDDWGDRDEHRNPDSIEYFLGRQALCVYYEYQRQLHADLPEDIDAITTGHVTSVWGDVGLLMIDIRGGRAQHAVPNDPRPYLGTQQWNEIRDALDPHDGAFAGVRYLMVVSPCPLVFLSATHTGMAAVVVKDFRGHWAMTPYANEQREMLDALWRWKNHHVSESPKQLLLVGGDIHLGGHTIMYRRTHNQSSNESKRNSLTVSGDFIPSATSAFKQVITSPIANASLPKVAFLLMETAVRPIIQIGERWEYVQHDWTNDRNYAIVDMRKRGGMRSCLVHGTNSGCKFGSWV